MCAFASSHVGHKRTRGQNRGVGGATKRGWGGEHQHVARAFWRTVVGVRGGASCAGCGCSALLMVALERRYCEARLTPMGRERG